MATNRSIPIEAAARIGVEANNRSSHFAGYWLELLTGHRPWSRSGADILISGATGATRDDDTRSNIRLWDYQVGHDGGGVLASAISGAATVIGRADGPPVPLPVEMPAKWCGAHGAMLALAECWRPSSTISQPVRYDVSAADILRAFCLQNSGGPAEMAHSWRRNGRLCIDHGGIFPMGFFACKDGHVAILGRSRRDWKNIQAAIGQPAWAGEADFEDPFAVARNSAPADALLEVTLARFTRDELLDRGLAHGAVIAPVYTQPEAVAKGVFRPGFMADGNPAMPFVVAQTGGHGAVAPISQQAPHPTQPLAGLRVIELAWIWSGPMVGQMLADLGAEVIKVESATRFDLYRTRGFEAMRGKMDEATRIESSLYFHSLNRNKIGLSIDLKSAEGRDALLDLAATSHLIIENFTVGTLERLSLGSAALADANPSLVQLSMSGPGRGSAVEDLRSYGLVLSALAGAEAHITADGEFVGSPTFSISDPNAALFATLAALAGVLSARECGRGMTVDLSQIEAAAALAGTPAQSPDVEVQGLDDDHYTMRERGRPCRAPVLDLQDTDDAAEFADCPGWIMANHPVTGPEQLVAAPWRVAGQRPPLHCTAPLLGSGNRYVLDNILGWADERIDALSRP
ncbi:MAG: CoA transferase [Hyphomicrobiaceae bacterium]